MAARDPFVQAVANASRHWGKGELGTRWGDVPEALMRGVEIFDAAMLAIANHDMRKPKSPQEPAPQPMAGFIVKRQPAHQARRQRG